jgi:hypothetical protein
MALHWELSKIHDYERVCFIRATQDDPNNGVVVGDRLISPLTNCLILASISVELGGITESNADQWYARLRVVQKLFGQLMIQGDGTPYEITADDVRAHIGLSVNVAPVTDMKWRTKQMNYALNDGVTIWNRAKEDAKKVLAS